MDHITFIENIYPTAQDILELAGGDINSVYQFTDNEGQWVIKINNADEFPGMFEKEAAGLKALGTFIKVPQIRAHGQEQNLQYLTMELIGMGDKSEAFWRRFANDLSNMHRSTSDNFGWDTSNYIGSLIQLNNHHHQWDKFLINERLQPMIEMAVNSGEVNYVEAKIIEGFYKRIDELYPKEPPALLHGDLWGGNYLINDDNEAVLIDPAVYYGHREMDIAMMHLFGGFDPRFFDFYNEVYPLEHDWKSRLEYSQIYPLLVHVNLFGRSYWQRVHGILNEFA